MSTPGLFPCAVLGRSDRPEQILRQVVERLAELPDVIEKNNLMAATSILSGLKLDRDVIQGSISSEVMRVMSDKRIEHILVRSILALVNRHSKNY